MAIIVIDLKDLDMHPVLKEELILLAKGFDEWDGTVIYRTAPEKIIDFTDKLKARNIAFHLKHF